MERCGNAQESDMREGRWSENVRECSLWIKMSEEGGVVERQWREAHLGEEGGTRFWLEGGGQRE